MPYLAHNPAWHRRTLYLKSMLVRTPLANFVGRLRWIADSRRRSKHPELWDIYLEEDRLAHVLDRILESDSCCIDVGSHIGSFLKLVVDRAPNGKHAALEPVSYKSEWLSRRFPEVEIFPFAASDVSGHSTFEENIDISSLSRLKPMSSTDKGSGGWYSNVKDYDVRTVRLDDLFANRDRIDLIKLDVEGNECATLKGTKQILTKHRPAVIFECAPGSIETDRQNIFQFVTEQLGYQVYTFPDFLFDKGSLSLNEFLKCGVYPFRAFNFIATAAPADHDWIRTR